MTARDVRIKRFDERVDRINPMSVVELDPWGHSWLDRLAAAAWAFTKSYEVRRFPGKVLERRVLIDDDPEVHSARAIETDHPIRRSWDMDATLQFALRNIARWRHDTSKIRERATKRSRSSART